MLRPWFLSLWSRLAMGAAFITVAAAAYFRHRAGIISDARDELSDEVREADYARAREIRDAVDAARGNVRVRDPDDDRRGYRD